LRIRFTLIIILTFFTFSLFAQEKPIEATMKTRRMAESAELEGNLYAAIYYYETLHRSKPHHSRTVYKLAGLYSEVKEFSKAKDLYHLLLNQKKKNNELYYRLAISYKQLGMYDSCLFFLNKCDKKQLSPELKKKFPIELEGAQLGKDQPKETDVVTIKHLEAPINTPNMEYAPSFMNDSTIFYSSVVELDGSASSKVYGQIFMASYENSLWRKSNDLPVQGLTDNLYLGNGCLSMDGKRYYFTQCFVNWQNKTICQLYYSKLVNGNFSEPIKIENGVNDLYFTTTQPTVGSTYNPDLEIIYFASDRPNGIGGTDIWFTVYNTKKNTFNAPLNAGSKINTPWNEATPFYIPETKTLYFSTDGRAGFGGFDVFKSTGELKSWFKPKNVGNYVNSNADELHYILNSRQNAGFFTSNRKGSYNIYNEFCCYDLYFFQFKNPENINLKGKLLVSLNPKIEELLKYGVEFRDSLKTEKYLNKAVVSLYLKDNENNDSLFIRSDTTNNMGSFNFVVERNQAYSVLIHDKDEYKGKMDVVTADTLKNLTNDIILDSKEIETLPEVPLIIKNIYYESGKSDLTRPAKHRLDSTLVALMKGIEDIAIEISSFTDDVGDATYNKKLAEQRAQKVLDYLVVEGIDSERLVAKGYGEEFPIAPNKNPDGSDNPQGREKNRRTEFKILGKYKQSAIRF